MINSDYKFNFFNFAREKKLRNADKEKNIRAQYDIKYLFGDRYVGETNEGFFSQTPDGKGTFYYNEVGRYEGDWKNGNKDGKGTFSYNDGDIYEGDWKNGKKDGKGTFYYNDGDIYEGEWRNHNKEGQGTFYYNNGDKYKGNWKNDERNGEGIYYFNEVGRYEGDWKNNEKDGTGTFYYNDGTKYKGNYENGILINGKEYYKSMPTNRKDVLLQINENDSKEEFLSKHEDGDFIYTDSERQDDNITNQNTNYDHLKIMYKDHGGKKRQLAKNIDQEIFKKYQQNNLKSVYISSLACYGGYYDSNNNNLFKIVENMMTSDSSNCVGFVSLAKAKNSNVYKQTTNKNGKKGAKRVPTRKKNIENISDLNYDKNNDFQYYCIIKENGKNKIYKIPYQLCYWREYLIDNGKFGEALEALKKHKNYKFKAEVILNNGKSTERNMEITIPSVWGKHNENRVVEQEINNRNNYIANKNLKNLNIQNQLG